MAACFGSRSRTRSAIEQRPTMLRSRSKGSPGNSPVSNVHVTPVPAPPPPDREVQIVASAIQKLDDRDAQHLAVDELHRLACVSTPRLPPDGTLILAMIRSPSFRSMPPRAPLPSSCTIPFPSVAAATTLASIPSGVLAQRVDPAGLHALINTICSMGKDTKSFARKVSLLVRTQTTAVTGAAGMAVMGSVALAAGNIGMVGCSCRLPSTLVSIWWRDTPCAS